MPSRVCSEVYGQFSSKDRRTKSDGGHTEGSSGGNSVSNSLENQVYPDKRLNNYYTSSSSCTTRRILKDDHLTKASNSQSGSGDVSVSSFGLQHAAPNVAHSSTGSTTVAMKGKRSSASNSSQPQDCKSKSGTSTKSKSSTQNTTHANGSGSQASLSTNTSTEERHKELDVPIQNLYVIRTRLGKGVSNLLLCIIFPLQFIFPF